MKKSIGTRIYTLLFVLFLAILGYNLTVYKGVNVARDEINSLSYTYMQVQKENENITKCCGDLSLNLELMALARNSTEANMYMKRVPKGYNELLDSVDLIKKLSTKMSDKELKEAFSGYLETVDILETKVNQISDEFTKGNAEQAVKHVRELNGILEEFRIRQDIYTAVLNKVSQRESEKAKEALLFVEVLATIIGVVTLILEFAVVLVISRLIIKPIKKANKHVQGIIDGIHRGEGNLTDRLTVKGKDEVAQLSTAINMFIAQLQEIMLKLREGSAGMNQQVLSINSSIATSEGNASDVSATMEEMAASMEEIVATLDGITDQSGGVLQCAKEMNTIADEGNEFVETIRVKAEGVRKDAIRSKDFIASMIVEKKEVLEDSIANSRSVEKINELTDEILSIASQTNLLALNASIEAAHAGDAGRGFAVVADEIRNLAANSQATANNIQEISDIVNKAVQELAENSNELIQFIDTTVLKDYGKLVDISTEYYNDADSVDGIMNTVKEKSDDLEITISNITEGIKGINIAVEESSQGVNLVADSAGHLVQMLGNIKEDAENNQEISNELSSEVQQFKHI